MFGQGYVVGAIVTAIGLYACSKYKKLAEREVRDMEITESFNNYVDELFKYWNGEISEEELMKNPHFGISEDVDNEMQKDRFY